MGVWTDDEGLNKLHKEHQTCLSNYETTYKKFKRIEDDELEGRQVNEEDDKFRRFWKTIIDQTEKCVKTRRNPTVSFLLN